MSHRRFQPRVFWPVAFMVAVMAAFLAGATWTSEVEPVLGTFTVLDQDSTYVVAAPHADFDTHTGEIARKVCEQTGWSCVMASGFETEGPRINVNRPTEGVRLGDTAFSERAARVFDAYMGKVHTLAPRLELYVEIHGNNHPDVSDIEIASTGVSEAWAQHVRRSLNRSLSRHGLESTRARIDVLDDIRYAASHNREFGALSTIQPALHIELPHALRTTHRRAVIQALAESLPQIAEHAAAPPQFAAR